MTRSLYFNIYFDEDLSKQVYSCEHSLFDNKADVINFLLQGYVRCVNNCRKDFSFDWDKEAADILRMVIVAIIETFLIHESEIYAMQSQDNKRNTDILDIMEQFQLQSSSQSSIRMFTRSVTQVAMSENPTKDIYIKYSLVYGPMGPAMLTDISLKMNKVVNMASYFILIKNLLPLLCPEATRILVDYFIGVHKAIDEEKLDWGDPIRLPLAVYYATAFLLSAQKHNNSQDCLFEEMKKYLPNLANPFVSHLKSL